MRRHVNEERPLLKPFLSNREASGKNSIDSIAAMASGTKNGLAKYKPAKTAKAIINNKAVFERDVGIAGKFHLVSSSVN